jgi:heme A synthase
VRLRVLHPTIAVLVSVYLILVIAWIRSIRPDSLIINFQRALSIAIPTQILAGVINVFLLAPVWLQLVHLLISDVIWILLVLFSVSALAIEIRSVPAHGESTLSVKSSSTV